MQAMNTNYILMSSKNPRDEKQTKGQRATNDVTIATMSFSHSDNNSMIHEITSQSFFLPSSNYSFFFFANFHDLDPLILF